MEVHDIGGGMWRVGLFELDTLDNVMFDSKLFSCVLLALIPHSLDVPPPLLFCLFKFVFVANTWVPHLLFP